MGGGLESRCVGRDYGADGAVRLALSLWMRGAAARKTTTRPKARCRKADAAIQYLMFLMMGVCTRNMSS